MSKKNQVQDAVIVSGEKSEKLIDQRVQKEIVKFNIADAGVNDLIKRSEGLEVASLDDVDKYEEIKTVLRDFVSTRTGIDKKRKEINKPFDDIIKGVNEEGKRLTSLLAPHEQRLAEEKAKFDAWKKEEDERLEREEEERLNKRVEELKSAGLVFNPQSMLYEVGDVISLDVVTIKKQTETDYAFLLEKVRSERAKIDKRLEEERLEREEAEKKQRELAEKNETDRLEIRAEKLETRAGKLTEAGFVDDEKNERFFYSRGDLQIVKSYDEVAEYSLADFKVFMASAGHTILENENNIKVAAELAQRAEILKVKAKKIESLGFEFDGGFYIYKSFSFPYDEVIESEDFEEVYSVLKSKIEEIDLEEQKAREAARLEAMPDLDKIERYMAEIHEISVPQMKTEAGALLLQDLTARIKSLLDTFSETVKNSK